MSVLQLLARIAVAAGLTGYILWKSHPREVLDAAAGVDWRPVAVAILLVVLDRMLMAYRAVVLLCTVDPAVRPPLSAVMRIFFVSTFLGTFLPASVGGDGVRAYSLSRLNVRGSDAVASVFMDRMLGVASVFLMAVVGLLLARDLARNATILTALGAAAGVCIVTLLLVFSRTAEARAAALIAYFPGVIKNAGHQILQAIGRYATFHGKLANVLACSVLVQALRILQAYCLGLGLGLSLPLTTYMAFIPLILLVMLLPITFNGIGTSQLAFDWFFARHAGVPAASAFTLSVLFIALGIVGNLPGGFLYAFGRGRQ